MRLSVAICTRNRHRALRRALQSLVAMDRHGGRQDWEVLVIDNASTDDTHETARSFADILPIRVVREHIPGLSNARNRAVREALGDWIIWIDDDVSVDRRWLQAYRRAIDAYPEAAVLGGQIRVELEGAPPRWLVHGLRWVGGAFASRSAADVPEVLSVGAELPYGANFALRRSWAQRFPFDPELGRHPLRPTFGGEETAVMAEILRAGGVGNWCPDAIVFHHIEPSRQSASYLRRYYRDVGTLEVSRQSDPPFSLLVTSWVRACGRACRAEARALAAQVAEHDGRRASNIRDAAMAWGQALGYGTKVWAMARTYARRRER